MKTIFTFLKKHYIWSVVILIGVIVLGKLLLGSSGNNPDTITLAPQEFIRTVAVAGKVKPADDVELGFESTGRIVAVYKKEGDRTYTGETLAVISSGEASANVMKAQADLDAEVAKLNELKGENVNDNSISTTRNTMFAAITNAYFGADDSVYNKINSFYNDETNRSEILTSYDDYDFYEDYKDLHNKSEYLLKKWKKSLTLINSLNYTESDIEMAQSNLIEIKKFVDLTATVVNDYNPNENSVYTKAEADSLRAEIKSARENINSAINKINDAKESVRDTKSEIPYQEARVKSAQATLNSYRSELAKRSITAPFNGVVTKQDAKVGEIVAANSVVMRLISI